MIRKARSAHEDENLRGRDDELDRPTRPDGIRQEPRREMKELVRVTEVLYVKFVREILFVAKVAKNADDAFVRRQIRHRQVVRNQRRQGDEDARDDRSESFWR